MTPFVKGPFGPPRNTYVDPIYEIGALSMTPFMKGPFRPPGTHTTIQLSESVS